MASGEIDLKGSVADTDPEIYGLICKEKERQERGLELIASENFTSKAVLDCLGSCFTNRYCEGYPGRRYYGGQEHMDQLEITCQKRALEAFRLDPEKWGVNVQPYSGSPANFAVYTAIVEPHGRIMGLDLPDGGHLTHGFMTNTKKISATSVFFESFPYKVHKDCGLINYEELAYNARLFKPKMIIAGISCYPRNLDYAKFRQIADQNGAYLMADMAHVSGLVAADLVNDPFKYCDIVTSTTHKSLRGPRSGLIFYRKGVRKVNAAGKEVLYNLENPINEAVFPGLQGGPHMHQVAGVAVALKQAATDEFKQYAKQVITNAQQLCTSLISLGHSVVTGGTDTHIVLIDLKPDGTSGAKLEYILEQMSITVNKNTCPGDKSALNPSGVRLGTPALTSRGFNAQNFVTVAEFIHKGIKICIEIQKASSSNTLKDFKATAQNEPFTEELSTLKDEVENFAHPFMMPGN